MSTLKIIYDKLFIDKNGRFVVAQIPNLPILLWLTCLFIDKLILNKTISTAVSVIGTCALIYWAYLEITSGANYFRRILGILVLAYTIFSLANRLF
jgi:hypothetical protein